MKLTQLHIDGFGQLVDRTIDFAPGLTIVYGENEAGKSTLARAIVTGQSAEITEMAGILSTLK